MNTRYYLTAWDNDDNILFEVEVVSPTNARRLFNSIRLSSSRVAGGVHCVTLMDEHYNVVGLRASAAGIAKYGYEVKDF